MERLRELVTLSWGLAVALGALGVALAARLLQMRRRTKRYRGALLELMSLRDRDRDREPDPARTQRILELLQ